MHRTLVAITGASSGIGEAFARRLASGHDLLLIARRKERLDELAAELSARHRTRVEALPADLTIESDLAAVADRIFNERNLALLINNAGFGTRGRFWETDFEAQENMHKLHVMATLRLTRAALRNMVPRDFGAIINVASVAAFVRSPGSVSYNATKSWMTAFTEALYLELQSVNSQVRIQALCPGYTYSEFHDTLKVKRDKLAGPAFWMSADQVVDASLDGIARRKLFVIPGWRYRLLTAVVSSLPTGLRLAVESAGGRRRARQLQAAKQ